MEFKNQHWIVDDNKYDSPSIYLNDEEILVDESSFPHIIQYSGLFKINGFENNFYDVTLEFKKYRTLNEETDVNLIINTKIEYK
jgi:hypothetical protein